MLEDAASSHIVQPSSLAGMARLSQIKSAKPELWKEEAPAGDRGLSEIPGQSMREAPRLRRGFLGELHEAGTAGRIRIADLLIHSQAL